MDADLLGEMLQGDDDDFPIHETHEGDDEEQLPAYEDEYNHEDPAQMDDVEKEEEEEDRLTDMDAYTRAAYDAAVAANMSKDEEYRNQIIDEMNLLEQHVSRPEKEETIGDRLYTKGQEILRQREEKVIKARNDKLAQELRSAPGKPQICPSSDVLVKRPRGDHDAFYKSQTDWLMRRNRLLDTKRELEAKEIVSIDREQKASAKSNKILAGRHKGPVENWVEREAHFKAAHHDNTAQSSFKPTISPAAQHLRRKGPVSERLYDVAKHRQLKQKTPPPKTREKKITSGEMSTLLNKMQLRTNTANIALERKRAEIESAEGSYQPEVNKRSRMILQRQGGHVPVHLRSTTSTQALQARQRSQTPPIKKKTTPAPLQESFWKKIEVTRQKHESRLNFLKREKEQDERRECTFMPKTNKFSGELAKIKRQSTHIEGESSPHTDFPYSEADNYDEEVPVTRRSVPRAVSGSPKEVPPAVSLVDQNFSDWEKEWEQQQKNIENILQQYTVDANKRKSLRVPPPELSPATPAITPPASRRSTSRTAGAGGARQQFVDPTPARQSTSPQRHPSAAVATAASVAPSSPPVQANDVSELQTVLDGWRQLEDQFSSSFEKFRLR
eukprot:TRINITY_DN2024_c0_g1_i1.p1 TRINITY_DN2024_c0_g1~~TRINITY_DN2024_c0_g1_i1.p1  ORF type:complete len:614 (+),score=113.15 TRINITY_DN2024_c0_g1_i1:67-1908(+)